MAYLIILIALLFCAFFAGMEIAYLSSNRLKIALDEAKGTWKSRVVSLFYKNESFFIALLLLGNNVSLVVFGIFSAQILEPWIENWGVMNPTGILLSQTIISTLLVLSVSEFLPKAIVQINPNRFLTYATFPMVIIYVLLYPPTYVVLLISRLFIKVSGSDKGKNEKVFSKIDLEHYVEHINAHITQEGEMMNEIQILKNALDFSAIKARDCMVPRTEIYALDVESTIADLTQVFIETGFSKIIIYRGKIDNIIGYVHSYELFKKPISIKQILLPIAFVPTAMPGKELLELFSNRSGKIAVVVDEYGGTAGIVTLEDIIEEIFGEIEDEHDVDELTEKQVSETEYLFSGRLEIDYLNNKYQLEFPESEVYDTLGGLIIDQLETIPAVGTEILLVNLLLVVDQVSEKKIEIVRVKQIN
jgi:CBS domain containing-hemolysin-like protein